MITTAMFLGILVALPVVNGIHATPTVRRENLPTQVSLVAAQQKVEMDGAGHLKVAVANHRKDLEPNCMAKADTDKPCMWTMDGCPGTSGAGCPNQATTEQDQLVQSAGTVCCTQAGAAVTLDETQSDTKSSECFGGTRIGNNPPHNFSAAEKFCKKKGNRLCTVVEVYNGRACGAGCGMDCSRIWTATSSECLTTHDSYEQGARCDTDGKVTTSPIVTMEICCSDEGIASGYKWVR